MKWNFSFPFLLQPLNITVFALSVPQEVKIMSGALITLFMTDLDDSISFSTERAGEYRADGLNHPLSE